MLTTIPVPENVTYSKIFEWTQQTPESEGVHIISYFIQAKDYCNWVILYSWCYVRTNGFTDPCMKRWDLLNLGENHPTFSDAVKSAIAEILKYPDTELMAEDKDVCRVYKSICDFCDGVVYTPPKPLPEPPKPEPIPVPPNPDEPQKPSEPGKPFNWSWLKWAIPLLGFLAGIGSLFLPGWAKVIVDMLLKLLSGLSG